MAPRGQLRNAYCAPVHEVCCNRALSTVRHNSWHCYQQSSEPKSTPFVCEIPQRVLSASHRCITAAEVTHRCGVTLRGTTNILSMHGWITVWDGLIVVYRLRCEIRSNVSALASECGRTGTEWGKVFTLHPEEPVLFRLGPPWPRFRETAPKSDTAATRNSPAATGPHSAAKSRRSRKNPLCSNIYSLTQTAKALTESWGDFMIAGALCFSRTILFFLRSLLGKYAELLQRCSNVSLTGISPQSRNTH